MLVLLLLLFEVGIRTVNFLITPFTLTSMTNSSLYPLALLE